MIQEIAIAGAITFLLLIIGLPVILGMLKAFCFYTTVEEASCKVYVLFGKVIGTIEESGLHILPLKIGPHVFLVRFFGKVHTLDIRLDQRYLRSRPVNSEEGTPMGIGVWYEKRVSDSVAYLFENSDPEGSLRANVTNTTVRSLSNMPLDDMLQDRHTMSREVRTEVSPKSQGWGYELGSVYIRKVHFRDAGMIHQIEQKVVNRLTQVTSAIRQAGDNQVDIIKSAADREASIEFAKAHAVRPKLVGQTLKEIGEDPEVMETLFEVLEAEKIAGGNGQIILMPEGVGGDMLKALEAGR
jgi:regulator of protease activity HflC (stomatin/prohibitin superfamily)